MRPRSAYAPPDWPEMTTVEPLKPKVSIGQGWFVYEVAAHTLNDGTVVGEMKAEKPEVPGKTRQREFLWQLTRSPSGNWDISNRKNGMPENTPFALDAEVEKGFRSYLMRWFEAKCHGLPAPSAAAPEATAPKTASQATSAIVRTNGSAEKSQPAAAAPQSTGTLVPSARFLVIPTKRIRVNPRQPRQTLNESELEETANSMAHDGQNTPIEVIEVSGDPLHDYELVKGERRWRGAIRKNIPMLEAIIRTRKEIPDEIAQHLWCLIGDFHHSSYSKLDLARALMYQHTVGKKTIKELAVICGKKSTQWVTNHLALVRLDPDLQQKLDPKLPRKEQLNIELAFRIAKLPENEQRNAFDRINKVDGYKLKLLELQKVAGNNGDRGRFGRPYKPADYVKSMLVAIPRMTAEATKTNGYSDAVFDSFVRSKSPEEVSKSLEQIRTTIEELRLLEGKIRKARKEAPFAKSA